MSVTNMSTNNFVGAEQVKVVFIIFLCFDLMTVVLTDPLRNTSVHHQMTSMLAGSPEVNTSQHHQMMSVLAGAVSKMSRHQITSELAGPQTLLQTSAGHQMMSVPTATAGEGSKGQTPKFECWSTSDDLPPFTPLTHPCFRAGGQVQCRCSHYLLDCSCNYGHLAFLPRMLPEAQVVNLSNNLLPSLDPAFFSNVSVAGVWLLDLYNNNMTHLSPKALAPFANLTTLLIGGNRLTYDDLKTSVFMVKTLKKLDMKCGGLTVMPPGYFNHTLAVHLEDLDLSWNHIQTLDMAVLQPLAKLKRLSVWHNNMYYLNTAYLPSLYYVSFHRNSIQQFPQTCKGGTDISLFPSLGVLDLNFNQISELTDPICLPKLHTLNLQYNQIQNFYSNMFPPNRFPALIKLELNQMEIQVRHVDAFAINSSRVKYITFGLNSLDFSLPQVHPDFFGGCHRVRILYLSKNIFHRVSVEKFQRLFQPMPLLETLFLDHSEIETLDSRMFSNMTHLQRLYLRNNYVATLPDRVFDDVHQLVFVSLSNNRLTTITSTTFSPHTIARLRSLDLSDNPFRCDCDIVWFQQWLRSDPQVFGNYQDQVYICGNLHNTTVQRFFVSSQVCVLSHLAANDIIIIISISIGFILVFTVLYGHRWHLRLWLYEICRGRHQRERRLQERELHPFAFDVFMAYAEEDMDWVHQKLLPTLKQKWGLRVCVHQTDFVPGKHIIDNISDCVDKSDRFLMVFSPHFARSPWCQFELKICQTCVMDRDDVMVLVMLQETESRGMTGTMLALLRTTTYIEWEDDVSAEASFWGRLRFALSDIIKT